MGTPRSRARIVSIRLAALACAATIVLTASPAAVSALAAPSVAHVAPVAPDAPARPSYADQLGTADRTATARSSASVMPYQPYTDWAWAGQRYVSTSETLKITKVDPDSHFFWAYDFAVGGTGVGYTGLQTGAYPSNGKIALFAIWGADAAQGPNCGPFDGEGMGWSCRLDPFAWTVGRSYALQIAVAGTDATGTWYKATVQDVVTKKVTAIGRIHHPATGGKVTGRGSWTEWFGKASASCAALKRSTVEWSTPTSNGGRFKATSHVNHSDPKDGSKGCARYTTLADGANLVRQGVGPK